MNDDSTLAGGGAEPARSDEAAASTSATHARAASARREDALRLRTAFASALRAGATQALMQLLKNGVVLLSDGGGKATAAINPLIGPDHVARFLVGIASKRSDLNRFRGIRMLGIQDEVATSNHVAGAAIPP